MIARYGSPHTAYCKTNPNLSTMSSSSPSAPPYLNPVVPGFNPDPSITRVNSSYFLATSTFEYFPGVPIYHSTDLLNWTLIGHALNRPSQLGMRCVEPGGGVFAPTLRWWKGKFYMCVCVVQQLSWDNVSVAADKNIVRKRDCAELDSSSLWTAQGTCRTSRFLRLDG